MPRLIRALPEGPLDIVGDVHGEVDALRRLLSRLGCDPDRGTAERPVVFVGDLVDRGPDSPGVLDVVRRLVEAGIGHAVAGNHELNLLHRDRKEGNGWFFGHNDGYSWAEDGVTHRRPFPSVAITDDDDRRRIADFLSTLPVALERADLRVVHACWDDAVLAELPREGDLVELVDAAEARVVDGLERTGLLARAERERRRYADLRDIDVKPDRPLLAVQAVALAEQIANPFRVLTSGPEEPIRTPEPYFVGGKWRFVRRSPWWDRYRDAPAVVVGHYWRRREPVARPELTWGDGPFGWAGPRGNVFCIDYSVGRRFLERWRHEAAGVTEARWQGGLAALRWPERRLVFDDLDEPVATTGFGGAR